MTNYLSWGRFPRVSQRAQHLFWRHDIELPQEGPTILPYAMGRSYGDCCLNDGADILVTTALDRVMHFDDATGILRCESGMTLQQILDFCVPRGWFLPVTPGTKFVSVGGAIANDVHGKNHHRSGTFGAHVRRFELLRSDGTRYECSRDSNVDLFRATIGGIGLTGLIVWAEIQLKPVKNAFIDVETIQFSGLDEFFEISASSDESFEYTVAWLDCVGSGTRFARGLFMRGNHVDDTARALPKVPRSLPLQVPFDFPGFVLNKWSILAFNEAYYRKQRKKVTKHTSYYDPFFYPLDAVAHWNRIYGKRGFFQFQCMVPKDNNNRAIREILERIVQSGQGSFLAVLKEFGDAEPEGMLSFPRPGVTLCLDFANHGTSTVSLLHALEGLVVEHGGRMYTAKDALMSPQSFATFYPQWKQFSEYRDTRFSSSFWRRVTGGE